MCDPFLTLAMKCVFSSKNKVKYDKENKMNVRKAEKWISDGPKSNYVQQGTLQLLHVERNKGMESDEHRNREIYQS